MFDLRVACLTRRLRALDTFIATLATSDVVLAAKAGTLVDQLDPVAPCNDTTALTRVAPPAPAVQAAVANLEATLERASALRIRGRYDELRPLLARLSAEAQRLGYRPFAARALLALGTMQVDVGEYAAAEKSLQRASSEAIAANDDWLAAEALVSVVDVVGYQLGRPAEAHRLADLAKASLERAGDPVQLRLRLLNAISRIHMLEGKHDAALAAIDQALELASADEAELTTTLSAKGVVLFELGRYDEARALLDRELELRGRSEGPRHPHYATALENRSNLYFVANEFDKGLADLREARRIKVGAFGETTPEIAGIENNLGVIAGLLGDWNEALRAARVALALSEKQAGPEHPTSAKARANIGAALREVGKLEQADVELQHALRLQEHVLGAEHQDVGVSLQELAELRLRQLRPRDAIPLFERANKIFVTALGADNPQVGYATSGLGRAQLAVKDVTTARATLATTVAALEQTGVDPVLLARTRLALADATWQLGDRKSAVAIASKAEPDLAKLPAGSNQPLRATIAAWQASHGR
jgi:tetratricopeptide (TPR) repeat protein